MKKLSSLICGAIMMAAGFAQLIGALLSPNMGPAVDAIFYIALSALSFVWILLGLSLVSKYDKANG